MLCTSEAEADICYLPLEPQQDHRQVVVPLL